MNITDTLGLWWVKPLAIAIAAAGIAALGYDYGASRAHAEDADTINDLRTRIVKAEASAQKAARDALVSNIETERKASETLAEIEADYLEKSRNAKNRSDRALHELRSSAVRLSVPIVGASCRELPSTATSASGGDGAATGQAILWPETAADLARLADDADAVAEQLSACQAALIADRKAINHE